MLFVYVLTCVMYVVGVGFVLTMHIKGKKCWTLLLILKSKEI